MNTSINTKLNHTSLICENFITYLSTQLVLEYVLQKSRWNTPILNLTGRPHRNFLKLLARFQENVFISMVTSKL